MGCDIHLIVEYRRRKERTGTQRVRRLERPHGGIQPLCRSQRRI